MIDTLLLMNYSVVDMITASAVEQESYRGILHIIYVFVGYVCVSMCCDLCWIKVLYFHA